MPVAAWSRPGTVSPAHSMASRNSRPSCSRLTRSDSAMRDLRSEVTWISAGPTFGTDRKWHASESGLRNSVARPAARNASAIR